MHWRRKWQLTPVFLPGESQGWGAWWAEVYGVVQSWTRLERLSSSRSFVYWRSKKAEHLSGLVQTPSSKFPPCPRDGLSHLLIVYCFGNQSCQFPVESQLSGLFLLLPAEPVLRKHQVCSGKCTFAGPLHCSRILSQWGWGRGHSASPGGYHSPMRPPLSSTGLAALPHILTFWMKSPWGWLAVWGDHRCMIWWSDSLPLASTLNLFLSNSPKLLDGEPMQHLPFGRWEN